MNRVIGIESHRRGSKWRYSLRVVGEKQYKRKDDRRSYRIFFTSWYPTSQEAMVALRRMQSTFYIED